MIGAIPLHHIVLAARAFMKQFRKLITTDSTSCHSCLHTVLHRLARSVHKDKDHAVPITQARATRHYLPTTTQIVVSSPRSAVAVLRSAVSRQLAADQSWHVLRFGTARLLVVPSIPETAVTILEIRS